MTQFDNKIQKPAYHPPWQLPNIPHKLKIAMLCLIPLLLTACQLQPTDHTTQESSHQTSHDKRQHSSSPPLLARASFETPLQALNTNKCDGQPYTQELLREPVKIKPMTTANGSVINTQLVVRIRERCVPVWNNDQGEWQMQTLKLRTYGFAKDPSKPITIADADDPNSKDIVWSAPGPNFIVHPASQPGRSDGTQFNLRLYNRMPQEQDPHACNVIKKCNTQNENIGLTPQGVCKTPISAENGGVVPTTPAQIVNEQVVEPPNCFHGNNSTNFHFHGFHVSPQENRNEAGEVISYQDNVFLELMPPRQAGDHQSHQSMHGEHADVAYGHADFALDPLRYTQAPGTHWYHAHKHGSTALQVLNGLVGTFEVRGEFDEKLQEFYQNELTDHLLVVQQLQEQLPGMGGADQTGAVLINGQANPIITMAPGEIQRWRFVAATMQASALLKIGFGERIKGDNPQVRQIAMDGVQFSPNNYDCQPILNHPDCSKEPDITEFDELSDFKLAPGNRIDILIQAPTQPGTHCMVLDVNSEHLKGHVKQAIRQRHTKLMQSIQGLCNLSTDNTPKFGPLLTIKVEGEAKNMKFPTKQEFPKTPSYLADIKTQPSIKKRSLFYQMYNQTNLGKVQFWISQTKFNPQCFNQTLTLDQAEEWTLYNNSFGVAHPFHIHQNPFQLIAETNAKGKVYQYAYPLWRDTLALPTSPQPQGQKIKAKAWFPNSDPHAKNKEWGYAKIRYVAKEFTGPFVNHCHILGHEDRGMMHATQAVCKNGDWATTGPVTDPLRCDEEGFCESDCQRNNGKPEYFPAATQCPTPPDQQSNWPKQYGLINN